MLIRQLLIGQLALLILSHQSTVPATSGRVLRISVESSKSNESEHLTVGDNHPKNITEISQGDKITENAKHEIVDEPKAATKDQNIRTPARDPDNVPPMFFVPIPGWSPSQNGRKGIDDLNSTFYDLPRRVQSDHSKAGDSSSNVSFSPDLGKTRLKIRAPSSNTLNDSFMVLPPRSRDAADLLKALLVDRRFSPLTLIDDPEPSDDMSECSYSNMQSDVVHTFVDAFDDQGCASCELDDEGQPIRENAEDFSPQFLPAGMNPRTATERLRELFQAGLLDRDTFSAEDRRRGSLRLTSQSSVNCTCSVGDQETRCSSGDAGRFCNQLPYTTVPSGILEVSHTNISELGVGSLEFVANVSVLRLAWNEIARVKPGAFANMSLLTNLSLAHNLLQKLDSRAFYGAAAVREVVLAYNMFTELTLATRALSVQLTPKLSHLNIGGNNFSTIGPEDFEPMQGAPLEDLQLHENNIQHIDPNTFLKLKNLRRLRLRNNKLPMDEVVALVEKMNNTSLELIDLSMIGEYTISQMRPILNSVANSSILSLMLNNYCFPNLYSFHFPTFPRLKELSMRSCGIKYICSHSFDDFPELESLDLRDNYFSYVPSAVILPTLLSLDLSRPALRKDSGDVKPFSVSQYRFRDMVNLRYLDLSYNNITKLERGAFVGLENLTVLLLKDAEIEHISNFSFSMLENLSELHLSNNYLSAQPFEHLWQGLTGLTVLFLDNCRINSSQLYLSEMPRTEILNLTGNSLRNLTAGTFHGLSSLNTVDLSENSIESWEERVFGDSRVLERIYLRYNSITWISTAMAEDFLELDLRVLMLGFNPFHCSCQLHDWLDGQDSTEDTETIMADWVLFNERTGGYVTNDIDDCYCHSPETFSNQSVLEFFTHSSLSPCSEPSLPADRTRMLFTMLPVFVSGMVAAVVIRLVYKNRWYLRYWLFKLTSKRWLKRLRKDNEGFLYDAFVSYSSEDANFVGEMIDQLEKTPPFYRLCVYERDFEIGNVISECILESINTSRKSILILTDHFAKSHWCRWEMNLVQCRLFEQTRDDLIIVKLGKIRSRHLTPTIRYLMRTRIYIEWGPSAQQQLLFWERLRTALRKPGGTPELPRTI